MFLSEGFAIKCFAQVVVKASMWFAKDKKDIRPEHIVDIIVKASLMEAAIYV